MADYRPIIRLGGRPAELPVADRLVATSALLSILNFGVAAVEPTTEGSLFWDWTDHTLALKPDIANCTLQVGQENWIRVVNKTGSTLTDGTIVFVNGAQGNRPTISPADADLVSSDKVVGVVTADILNNAEGYVTISGIVRGQDTSSFSTGDELWLSSTPGVITNVKPAPPKHAVRIGYALNSTNSGSILVAIDCDDIGTHAHANHGIDSTTDNTISFDSGTRTATIAPTGASFIVWHEGNERLLTAKNVIIPDTTGVYFIYLDASDTLVASTSPWDLLADVVPVMLVYYYQPSPSDYSMCDERHGKKRNLPWHRWAHLTLGTRYESGLSGTFTNTTLSLTQGVIHDEDIVFSTGSTRTACRLWRYSATNAWMYSTASSTPYLVNAGTLQYDNAGTPTNVSVGSYVINDVYATTDTATPIWVRVGVEQFATLAQARAALTAPTATWNGLGAQELKLLYRVIYRNLGGTPTYIQATDFRSAGSVPGGGSPAVAPHASTHYAGGSDEIAGQSLNGLRTSDSPTFAALTTTGSIQQGAGSSGYFHGLSANNDYMRIHGGNAMNTGAGIILFGGSFGSGFDNLGRLYSGSTEVASWTATGVTVAATTPSTSTTTGALVVGGGIGVGKAGFFGGIVSATHSTTGDNSAYFANTHSTGYGPAFRGGGSGAGYYCALFQKYNGTEAARIDGNGGATFNGAVTVDGSDRFFQINESTVGKWYVQWMNGPGYADYWSAGVHRFVGSTAPGTPGANQVLIGGGEIKTAGAVVVGGGIGAGGAGNFGSYVLAGSVLASASNISPGSGVFTSSVTIGREASGGGWIQSYGSSGVEDLRIQPLGGTATFGGAVTSAGDFVGASTSGYYFGDRLTDGTWRLRRDGSDLVLEHRQSGAYVEASRWVPPV